MKKTPMAQKTVVCFSFVFLICVTLFENTSAQQKLYRLWGIVRDSNTGEALPYTNIRVLGTTKGTITNDLGMYVILLAPGSHDLVFSYIGYRSDTLRVHIADKEIRCDITLSPTVITMPGITVSAYRHNPAERVILKAIANKRTVLSDLHSYEFQAYTKTVLRIEKKEESQQDTIIAGILETQTTGYWKEPDQYKETITARRQTANFLPANNIFTVGKIPNFNDDVIVLKRNSVIGPTAPDALSYYSYEMIDTTAIDNVMVFRIKIIPKHKNIPLFKGIISIADSTFSVMEVDVSGNEALDLSPRRNVRYREQFALYENQFWLPIEVRIDYEVKLSFPSTPPVFVEQISVLHNYKINRPIPSTLFDKYQISVQPTADDIDSTTWASQQTLPLTADEIREYQRIDSLMANTNFFDKAILFLVRAPAGLRKLPITSFSDFFHFNRVEGAYLGFGLKVKDILPSTALRLRAGYGFSDKDWKYGVEIEQFLSAKKEISVGFEIYKRISFREPEFIYSANTISGLCLIDKNDYYDYYLAQGWRLFSRMQLTPQWNLEVGYFAETNQSLQKTTKFSLLRRSVDFRENPPIIEGDMRGAQISLNYDTRKFIDAGLFVVSASGRSSWTINAKLEYTDKRYFQSDFDFSRYFLSVRRRQLTFATGYLDLCLQLGASRGVLPPQKLFDLPCSISGLSPFGVFRTLGVKEFAGDRSAALLVEHNFGSFPFRSSHFPIVKDLGIDLIVSAGAGWTGLSGGSERVQIRKITPTEAVFYEIGFGLGRILTFFRLDFSWRLTHRGDDNFSFTIGSSMFR